MSLPGEWHEYLRDHDIFKANTNSAKSSIFADTKPSLGFGFQSHPSDPCQFQRQQRVVALRIHDLFVAVGSELRVLNLAEVKSEWTSAAEAAVRGESPFEQKWLRNAPYKVLSADDMNFPILSLTLNHNGRFLAVAGRNHAVVLRLPESFSTSTSFLCGREVRCRSYRIGKEYYGSNGVGILKMAWHPLSQHDNHLLVLDDKSTLKMFDLFNNVDEPEWHSELSRTPDERGKDAVTFALGGASKDTSGWEPFTLFYMLRNGEMYALCPVIPSKSIIRREHLQGLACLTSYKLKAEDDRQRENKRASSMRADDDGFLRLRLLQCRWVYELIASTKSISPSPPPQSEQQYVDGNVLPIPVHRRGPFKEIHGSPAPTGEVCDMMYIATEPSNILSVTYTNGEVRHYLLGIGNAGVEPQWAVKDEFDHQLSSYINIKGYEGWRENFKSFLDSSVNIPLVSLFETFTVSSTRGTVAFALDEIHEDAYYIYHPSGAHIVKMSSWLDELRQLNSTWGGRPEKLSPWKECKEHSKVDLLVNSAPLQQSGSDPITGLVEIKSEYLSHLLLALPRAHSLEVVQLKTQDDLLRLDDVLKDEDGNEIKWTYESLLSPPFKLPEIPSMPKITVPSHLSNKKEVVITEESLRYLGDRAEEIARQTHELKKQKNALEIRLTAQEKELARQVSEVQDLSRRMEAFCSEEAISTRREKIKAAETSQFLQKLQIDKTLRYTIEKFQPSLTKDEQLCFDELEEAQERLEKQEGYLDEMEMLQKDLKGLHVTQKKFVRGGVPSSIASRMLQEVRDQMPPLIDGIKQRVEDLDKRLPAAV